MIKTLLQHCQDNLLHARSRRREHSTSFVGVAIIPLLKHMLLRGRSSSALASSQTAAVPPASAHRTRAGARLQLAWPDLLALLFLGAVTLVFYRQTLFSNLIIVDYDVFTYFYPQEQYAASRLLRGELPLWNPYLFTGAPFLANIQTGVFYPFNLLFLILSVPRAYVYSAAIHIYLAGAFVYAFARRTLGLGVLGAVVVGLAFAFGGFVTSLVTHLNQLQAAAWLPLLFLLLSEAYQRQKPGWGFLGGVVFCLQILAGHTQVLYLTAVGITLYFAGDALVLLWEGALFRRQAPGTFLSRLWDALRDVWSQRAGGIAPLATALALGLGLAAVQLLPTFELASLSIRAGGLTYDEASSFSFPPWMLARGLFPLYLDPPPFSEWQAYVGVTSLVLAAVALSTRVRHRQTFLFVGLALTALLLAFGQFDPLYPRFYRLIPGLKLFRVPARWLLLYSLALASLAGLGLESLSRSGPRWGRLGVLLGVLVGPLMAYALARTPYPLELPSPGTVLLWGAFGVIALGLVAAASPPPSPRSSPTRSRPFWDRPRVRSAHAAAAYAPTLLVALLAGELIWASHAQVINRPNLPEAYSSLRSSVAHLLTDGSLFRTLALSDNSYDPGDLPQMRSYLDGVLSPQQVLDFVTYTKHKETLTPNLPLRYGIASLDGYDGGLLPLRDYVELKALLVPEEAPADGRLREQLRLVPDLKLLSWLNVKYLLMDRVHDVWVDGVYYDLGLRQRLKAGPDHALVLSRMPRFATTAVGVISHLTDAAAVPNGAIVATLQVTATDGQTYALPLRAGQDTAEARYDRTAAQAPVAHAKARTAAPWADEPGAWSYYTLLRLPQPIYPRRLTLVSSLSSAHFEVQGISLVDERLGQSQPLPLSDSLQLVHVGDVKIYENLAVLPRAILVGSVRLADSPSACLAALKEPTFQPSQEAVVIGSDWPGSTLPPQGANPGQVTIDQYQPERVLLHAELEQPAVLILTDAYYPGWRAKVDGKDTPLFRADYLFRGLMLDPGEHEVELTYEPLSFRLGLAISLVSLLASGAFAVWLCFGRWRCIMHKVAERGAI